MGYIYKITNKINGKMYIGKTELEPPELRWREHKNAMKHAREAKRPLYKALNKYGVENFTFEIIEKVDSNLEEREQYYIKKYRTYVGYEDCNGYNLTLGGDGKAYLDLDENEVIMYHIVRSCYVLKYTAEHFNVDNGTIKRILRKHNIFWLGKKALPRLYKYEKYGAIIQVDPTNTYIVNLYSCIREANEAFDTKKDDSNIRDACTKRNNSNKAYGYYWYYEKDIPKHIKKDLRLYDEKK